MPSTSVAQQKICLAIPFPAECSLELSNAAWGVTVSHDGQTITEVSFTFTEPVEAGQAACNNALSEALAQAFDIYFNQRIWAFQDFLLRFPEQTTNFERAVWQALRELPSGEVCSYGDLAQQLAILGISRPGAARGVGQALRKNPFPIIVPCHRVLPAASVKAFQSKTRLLPIDNTPSLAKWGGFMGPTERGRKLKQALLYHESRFCA